MNDSKGPRRGIVLAPMEHPLIKEENVADEKRDQEPKKCSTCPKQFLGESGEKRCPECRQSGRNLLNE